jgi:hypothetical protein
MSGWGKTTADAVAGPVDTGLKPVKTGCQLIVKLLSLR